MTSTLPEPMRSAVGQMPAGAVIPQPPACTSAEDERAYRKREPAAGFRIFGRLGFPEGVAGHITVRDPGNPELFWVNPFDMSFGQIKASDLAG
ncbi:class II aldolase/adducin family protein [Streptomyces auratus]|uniref:class II aldolase/adducin family protein n=1 Tax=Streptomyces TaxID=1883 RepID=UPI003D1E3390